MGDAIKVAGISMICTSGNLPDGILLRNGQQSGFPTSKSRRSLVWTRQRQHLCPMTITEIATCSSVDWFILIIVDLTRHWHFNLGSSTIIPIRILYDESDTYNGLHDLLQHVLEIRRIIQNYIGYTNMETKIRVYDFTQNRAQMQHT